MADNDAASGGGSARATASGQAMSGRPRIGCRTFAAEERIRVPRPAARTRTVSCRAIISPSSSTNRIYHITGTAAAVTRRRRPGVANQCCTKNEYADLDDQSA